MHRCRYDLGQHVENIEDAGVGHQWQVDEFFDLPASKLRPDAYVFTPGFVTCRMGRPVRSAAPEVFKAYLDDAIAPIQRGVKCQTQSSDHSDIMVVLGTVGEQRKPIFGRLHICGQ